MVAILVLLTFLTFVAMAWLVGILVVAYAISMSIYRRKIS